MKSSILAFVIATVVATPSFGQPPDRPGRGARERLGPAEVMRVLDGYALVQAQESLRLTDEQYGTFVTRLRKLQETRRRHQQARNQILAELRRLVGPEAAQGAAPEPAIREKLDALRAHEEKAAAELRQAHEAIDQLLDPAQQARFRLFEEQLERRKLDLIMRARQAAAGRGGGS
jgi:hypothetical protein